MSCFNQGDCLKTATNLVKVKLLNKTDGSIRETTFLSVMELSHQADNTTDTIRFVPVGGDTTVNAIQLPLDPTLQESAFVFMTSDSVVYNLDLKYNTFSRVVAADCGAFLYYENLSVSDTNFDRVKILSTQLLTSVTTNLEIYF